MYSGWFNYSYDGIAVNLMATSDFWFTLILTVTILVIPVVAERFYVIDTRPTLNDKVRLKQKVSTSRSRESALVLRRTSTMRRSTRPSKRSGYAWAHTEGFGELITTGRNMKQTTKPGVNGGPISGATRHKPSPLATNNVTVQSHSDNGSHIGPDGDYIISKRL